MLSLRRICSQRHRGLHHVQSGKGGAVSDIIPFKKAKFRQPERGEYKPWFSRVMVGCPNCGESYQLDHAIDKLGNVSPSVECPTTDCNFHNYIKLEGWDQ